MSDFKGTPGPWEWDSEDGILARHDGIGIGSVFPCDPCRYRKGEFEYGAVTESNARLIAAAPDLLEALKLLASPSMSSVMGNGESSIGWPAGQLSADQRLTVARAAIAKATGEQP